MNEPFSDELISAYLDGELTADQQEQVERALADSAEHRQMFEELRALSGSLQALPEYKLDEKFSDRVLRRAERAMLSGSADDTAAKVQPADMSPVQPARSWRGVALAVASLAALVLVAIFALRPPDGNHLGGDVNVAQAPSEAQSEIQRDSALSDSLPAADAVTDEDSDVVGGQSISRAIESKDVPDLQSNHRRLESPAPPAEPGQSLGGAAAASPDPGDSDPGDSDPGDSDKNIVAPTNRDNSAATRPSSSAAKPVAPISPIATTPPARAAIDLAKGVNAAPAEEDRLFVVTVMLTPESWSRGDLYQILHKHQIWPEANASQARSDDHLRKKAAAPSDRGTDENDATPAEPADRYGNRAVLQGPGAGNDMNLVYVQASYAQVQATLDDLRRQGGQVAVSTTEPLSGGSAALGYEASSPAANRRGGVGGGGGTGTTGSPLSEAPSSPAPSPPPRSTGDLRDQPARLQDAPDEAAAPVAGSTQPRSSGSYRVIPAEPTIESADNSTPLDALAVPPAASSGFDGRGAANETSPAQAKTNAPADSAPGGSAPGGSALATEAEARGLALSEQRIRVLFVLRAVAPAPADAAERTPDEP